MLAIMSAPPCQAFSHSVPSRGSPGHYRPSLATPATVDLVTRSIWPWHSGALELNFSNPEFASAFNSVRDNTISTAPPPAPCGGRGSGEGWEWRNTDNCYHFANKSKQLYI